MSALTGGVANRVRGGRYLTGAVLLGVFVFHVAMNWMWVATNVALMGWDRSSHLAKTLISNDVLQEIDIRSLFTALTWPWNRPPLPFLTVVPFYRFFGVSTDVALMSNCLYLAILLWSVYEIGRLLYGRKAGLLAAFLVSFYPILFSISRLSYVDYALTAMVALAIHVLLKTDGFRHSRWSLVLGLVIGLGLLTKWPFIAFAGAPIAYQAWHSGALKRLLFVSWGGAEGSTGRRRIATSPLFHILAAFLVTAAWYLPNWDRLPGFLLGQWIPLISWLLLSCTFYVVSRAASQGTNLLSAILIGGTLGSAWSLPNLGFSGRFVFVAYGGVNIQGKGLSIMDPTFYGRYLSMMLTEQLSPLYFAAFLLAIAVLAFAWFRKGPGWAAWRQMSQGAWLLLLWLGVPFLIFTLSQTWNSRFDIALLPAAALITARGLCSIRATALRLAIVSLLVVCGVIQCFILSYDSLYGISETTVIGLPAIGRLNLLGEGAYIMPPDSDRNDSGYWVAPQILSAISAESDGPTTLGLLVNNTHLNADILRYQALLEFEEVEVRDLARDESGAAVYTQVFASDYAVFSTHDPYKLSDGAKEAVRRIGESTEAFQAVFEPLAEYQFPDGEEVFLLGKRAFPAEPQVEEYYQHLVAGLGATLRDEVAIIVSPPQEASTFARFYRGSATLYLLPTGDSDADEAVLAEIVDSHDRVDVVLRGEMDPDQLVEGWLSVHAYRTGDEWYGDVRSILYATPAGEEASPLRQRVEANLGGYISLVSVEVPGEAVEPEGIVRVTLEWCALEEVADDYAVFVHLLDADGQVVAQHDGTPAGGFRPTTTWSPGETISDKHGLLIPQGTAPGEYWLVAGLYLPATGERLQVLDRAGGTGADSVVLGHIQVLPAQTDAGGGQSE
jgi:4-amino-4-deoxy-L-arabinose transferase-like glycosyltransferase